MPLVPVTPAHNRESVRYWLKQIEISNLDRVESLGITHLAEQLTKLIQFGFQRRHDLLVLDMTTQQVTCPSIHPCQLQRSTATYSGSYGPGQLATISVLYGLLATLQSGSGLAHRPQYISSSDP